MYTKILVPLDGSKTSETVLSHVEVLARRFGAEVILLSVEPHPLVANYGSDVTRWELKNRDEAAEVYLNRIAEVWRQSGISVSTSVIEGSVDDMILEQATHRHADLIAMATHGVAGVEGILLSGVAGRVFHHSPIPMLLVKSGANEEGSAQ